MVTDVVTVGVKVGEILNAAIGVCTISRCGVLTAVERSLNDELCDFRCYFFEGDFLYIETFVEI